jgi:hypothetical protein
VKNPPEPKSSDQIFSVVRAAAFVVPGAGQAVAALMDLVGPAISTRREVWFAEVASAISALEERLGGYRD